MAASAGGSQAGEPEVAVKEPWASAAEEILRALGVLAQDAP